MHYINSIAKEASMKSLRNLLFIGFIFIFTGCTGLLNQGIGDLALLNNSHYLDDIISGDMDIFLALQNNGDYTIDEISVAGAIQLSSAAGGNFITFQNPVDTLVPSMEPGTKLEFYEFTLNANEFTEIFTTADVEYIVIQYIEIFSYEIGDSIGPVDTSEYSGEVSRIYAQN